jgi:hypothetical protein
MNQIKSPTIYLQVTVAALLYNLLRILAWELPLAVRMGWRINIIGDVFIISITIISIILISMRKIHSRHNHVECSLRCAE